MNQSYSGGDATMGVVAILLIALFGLGMLVLVISAWAMIFKRAGYSAAMVLLMLIPLVNFIWLLVFAFSRWPIQKELDTYRAQAGSAGSYPAGTPQQQFPR